MKISRGRGQGISTANEREFSQIRRRGLSETRQKNAIACDRAGMKVSGFENSCLFAFIRG